MEELRKNEFQVANRNLLEEIETRKEIEKNIVGYQKMFKNITKSRVSPRVLTSYSSYLNWLISELDEQKKKVTKCKEILEKQRDKLNEAIIDRKIYEKLKNNSFEEYKMDVDREEQNDLDETTSQLFNYFREK